MYLRHNYEGYCDYKIVELIRFFEWLYNSDEADGEAKYEFSLFWLVEKWALLYSQNLT